MLKIARFTFYDLIRNRWTLIYGAFYFLVSTALFMLSGDLAKVVVSLANITIVLAPLIGILFGIMYYYGSQDFIRLLLAQPISRKSLFSGLFLGMSLSLTLSFLLGLGIPLLLAGIMFSEYLVAFVLVLATGLVLSVVFSMLAFLIGLFFSNRIRGFGTAIFTWLFFAIIYDGIFLLLLLLYREYPLEGLTLTLTYLNPIDLARILITLQLDISAIMGYTGAVLQRFLGAAWGTISICLVLAIWVVFPYGMMLRKATIKDF